MSDCARGCTTARKHETECPDQDACKGCQPREAEHGLLCYGCHVRLLDWLKNAPGQHALLHVVSVPSMSQALNADADAIRSTIYGIPSALNVAAASAMTDLTDVLSAWVEMLCEQDGMSGPVALKTRHHIEHPPEKPPPALFEIHSACTWLTAQIERLQWCPGIGDLWEELGMVMSQAHALAPWRKEAARLKGIECPECHRIALARYGGDEHVTCQRCNAHIAPGRYAIWVRQLAAERKAATTTTPAPNGILTYMQAADLLGISPFTIKCWRERGQLRPVRDDAKPLLFREQDVLECHRARMSQAMHERLDTLWEEVLADVGLSA